MNKNFCELKRKLQRGPFVGKEEDWSRSKIIANYVSPYAFREAKNEENADFKVRSYCIPLFNGQILGGTLLLIKSKKWFGKRENKWYFVDSEGEKKEFDENLWFVVNPQTNKAFFPKRENWRDNFYRF